MTAVAEMKKTKAGAKLALPLSSLKHALGVIAPAIERKTTIPVLSAVRVERKEHVVEFAGTNLELTIRVRLPQAVIGEDAEPILLPALKLQSFANLLQGADVSITCADERKATLRCGRSTAKLPLQDAANFPALNLHDGDGGTEVKQEHMKRMLYFTSFAVSTEASRYTLCAAQLDAVDGRMSLVATDGHRLARYSVPTSDARLAALLPDGMLTAIAKTLDGGKQPLRLNFTEDAVYANLDLESGAVALSHRKISGQFPNWQAVMPTKRAAVFTVDAGEMNAALKRCLAFADERSGAVKLTFASGELAMRSVSPDAGETEEAVDAACTSAFEPFTSGFNAEYLIDAFSRLSGAVEMRFAELNAQTSMMIFAQPEPDETFEYVVMPMRV